MQRTLNEYFRRSSTGAPIPAEKRPRLELTELALPLSCIRPRREGKLTVRPLPRATIERVEALLVRVNGDGPTMTRLYDQFGEFATLNGLDVSGPSSRARVLWLFIIDALEQQIKASSCKTYTSLLIEGHARAERPIASPLVGDLLKALALLHCEEETEHAPDLPYDVCWAILHAASGALRLSLFLLLALACRCADAENLHCGDIRLNTDSSISVSFSLTKNHRSKHHAYSIRIVPLHLIPELGPVLRSAPTEKIPALSAEEVTHMLRSPGLAHVVPAEVRESISSYTFRRAGIQHLIESHRSMDGSVVDWLSVTRVTGHRNSDVVRVAYTKKFDNTL